MFQWYAKVCSPRQSFVYLDRKSPAIPYWPYCQTLAPTLLQVVKTLALITGILLIFLISSECLAQLVAEAGKDTALCADSPNSLTIGGNPTASGGTPPYQYIWSGSYRYAGHTFSASYMLEDTTVANPVFREGAILDSVILYVTVKDQENNIAMDSIQIRLSKYVICTGECRHDIFEGDSVQLSPYCVIGGIPPLEYHWTPAKSLSDTAAANPWAKPTETTSYNVTITDSIGCVATSGCFVFVIPNSINELPKKPELLIYPNPSSKVLHIKLSLEAYSKTTFKLINISGKTVFEATVSNPELSLDVNGITPGTYVYQWDSKDKLLASGKIIIE